MILPLKRRRKNRRLATEGHGISRKKQKQRHGKDRQQKRHFRHGKEEAEKTED